MEKFEFKFTRFSDKMDCENIREIINNNVCPLATEKKRILYYVRDGKESFETLKTRLTDEWLTEKMNSRKEFKIHVVGTLLPDTLYERTEEYIFTFRAFRHCILCGVKQVERNQK